MPNILETQIDQDTPDDLLELCARSADRTSDVNILRKASEAKAEQKRRDREYERTQWQERFNAESRERAQAQEFQEGQANRHLGTARLSAAAAIASAIAAIFLVAVVK